MKLLQTKDYLLLIDEEAEIKEGWAINPDGNLNYFGFDWRAMWTREQILDCKNVIAYYPLTKEAKELDLPLLPNPFEGEVDTNIQTRNFNKQVKNPYLTEEKEYQVWERAYVEGFNDGVAQSKQFSLEDMIKAFNAGRRCIYECEANGKNKKCYCRNDDDCNQRHYITAEEYVQSLSIQQLPVSFEPEYDIIHTDHAPNGFEKLLKFKTNSEGKKEIQGTYKY